MKKATKKSIMAKVNKEFHHEVFRCILICCLFFAVAMLMTNLSAVCIKYTYYSWQCRDAEENGKKMKWVGPNQQQNWLPADIAYYDRATAERDTFIANNSLAKFFFETFGDTTSLKCLRFFIFVIIGIVTFITYKKTYKRFKRTTRHLAFELVKKVKLEKKLNLQ